MSCKTHAFFFENFIIIAIDPYNAKCARCIHIHAKKTNREKHYSNKNIYTSKKKAGEKYTLV